ncbi:MAG: DNA-binding response regulator [Saprospiraceae bacterium]|nr:MAG: DNA-binding response regulator [Saprospiraceae bacterium]
MQVLIIEDDPNAAHRLQNMIALMDATIEIQGPLKSIQKVISWMDAHQPPDLIFMDIHLEDGICFDLFKFRKVDAPIIITSGDAEYALRAFSLNTLDYLLKPIRKEQLEHAWRKFWRRFEQNLPGYQQASLTLKPKTIHKKRLVIQYQQRIKVVEIKDAAYFFMKGRKVYVVTNTGVRYPLHHALETIAEMLDQASFFRINRQMVVNINAIKEMQTASKSRVKINLYPPFEEETIVSTDRSSSFKKWLKGEDHSAFQ